MPPRLLHIGRQWLQNVSSTLLSISTRSFAASSRSLKSATRERPKFRDSYAVAQSLARKAANLSKRVELQEQRAIALGDPVRGITTPFIQSFDTGTPIKDEQVGNRISEQLNHFITSDDVKKSRQRSEQLSAPTDEEIKKYDHIRQLPIQGLLRPSSSPSRQEREKAEFEDRETRRSVQHKTAAEAILKIVNLRAGNSKDRTRLNVQRCIAMFGRHHTDLMLAPKPAARLPTAGAKLQQAQRKERIGPDTGSSEVQIAVLTAKIRVLADFVDSRGRMDKVNKRNLRLLVHRRQKLLGYLRRKERGGPRWTNLVDTLGLTEGTWKGEISL